MLYWGRGIAGTRFMSHRAATSFLKLLHFPVITAALVTCSIVFLIVLGIKLSAFSTTKSY